jgi:hypothetical protein
MGYFSWDMPLWEKAIWILLFGYLVLVFVVYWVLGWSQLGLVG